MFTRYGIEFPNDSPDASVELWMYRNQDVVKDHNGDLLGQSYHLSKAFNILFDDNILTWHPWLDEHIDIWCDNRFATIWGPAACGKSNDFGLIALVCTKGYLHICLQYDKAHAGETYLGIYSQVL